MFKRVVVDADQELTDDDIARLGQWPQDGDVAIVKDFLLSGRGFTGFGVTAPTLTSIEVAIGHYYDAGSQYGTDAVTPFSLADYIPFTAGQKRVVTLIVQGLEQDGYSEGRNNEREIQQSDGSTVVQRVGDTKPRAKVCNAVLALIAGAPSSIPVALATPLNATAIANILVGTAGVESITRIVANQAPALDAIARAFAAQQETIDLINQAVGGLRNDLAALGRLLANSVSITTLVAVTTDIARIKDKLQIPDTASPYGSDHFLTADESDTTNVDYKARIEEGIRFPYANFWRGPIALQNANDTNFMHAAQGLICPKYTPVDGILVSKQAGTMPLGGTTYQTMTLAHLTMSRQVERYGDYFTVCENNSWWQSGQYDPAKGIFAKDGETYQATYSGFTYGVGHDVYRVRKYWFDTVQDPYDAYVPVTSQIQGVLKAQTFIQSQDRWVPAVKLGLASWGAGAQITAVLLECKDNGEPDPRRVLDKVSVLAKDFRKFDPAAPADTMTRFVFSSPKFVTKAKGMYAVQFATTGDVQVAYAEGQQFLGGTLFDNTDGRFYQGDLTRDLCFGVEYCHFDITRLPVLLQGLNLDGGIHDIAILAGMIVPTNADATWELQVGGTWTAIAEPAGDDTLFGSGVTPFYGFRVSLSGNEWAMPIIDMAATQVTIFRADDDFDHISFPYPQPAGFKATQVVVTATVGDWDPTRHTAVAKLRYGAGFATKLAAAAVVTKPVVNRDDARDLEWTFNIPAPGADTFKIEILGTTNNPRVTYHVEERVHRCS